MINDFSPYKLAGGRITQKRPSTDLFHNNGVIDFAGIVDGYSAPNVPVPVEGFVTLNAAGDVVNLMGIGDLGAGVTFDLFAVWQQASSIGASMQVIDPTGATVADLNTFDGIVLGDPVTDTATGRRIFIDGGGVTRFQVDGGSGDIFTIGDYLGANINATTVAPNSIGTAGQTTFFGDGSNLTGLPTASDLLFDATVSDTPGADYPTVATAVAAGKRRLYLYDIITEVANTVAILGNYKIYLEKGCNWDHGDFIVNLGGVINVDIIGYGQESWANTTGTPLWSVSAGSQINRDGPSLRNNSTLTGSTYNLSTTQINIQDCYFVLPNLTGFNGFVTATGNANNYLNNVTFSGGGASSGCALSLGQGSATNITLVDNFSTTSAAIIIGNRGQISNLLAHTSTEALIKIDAGQLENYLSHGSSHPNFEQTGNGGYFTNGQLGDGNFDVSSFNSMRLTNVSSDGLLDLSDASAQVYVTNCKFDTNSVIQGGGNHFTNFETDGTLEVSSTDNVFVNTTVRDSFSVTGGNPANNLFSNCNFTDNSTASCDSQFNKFSNCKFAAGFNISNPYNSVDNCEVAGASAITASKNRISNSRYTANSAIALSTTGDDTCITACQIGQDAGGGIGTIDIGVGAARCMVTACSTDAAIVDNNGGAGLVNNFIY